MSTAIALVLLRQFRPEFPGLRLHRYAVFQEALATRNGVNAQHYIREGSSPTGLTLNAGFAMEEELLTARQAAERLGIARGSFYDWLAQSNAGTFTLQGQPVTINYLQGGGKGQGRILIESREISRLKDLMRVHPRSIPRRQPPVAQIQYPGITVKPGRPPGT